ncbi:MAG: hypothetical protein M1813_001894 [Trichoglossum hirsutum]|nr:MAG: hypothetical protein M1813_001894 [Trichoglossum hirsutum]
MRSPRPFYSLQLPLFPINQVTSLNFRAWPPSKSALLLPDHRQPRRHFLPGLTPGIQTLHANRTLPYPSAALYEIVADIESYSFFLPYCLSSSVSRWSSPSAHGSKRWPTEAELRIGWGGLDERFVSRVLCTPGSVVEAISGNTQTAASHPLETGPPTCAENSLFTHLLTRWTIRPCPYKPHRREGGVFLAKEQTEVDLDIEFQFANPIYSALSKAAVPKVASMMIEAFEGRVKELLDAPVAGSARSNTIEKTEGVIGKP